MPNINTIAIIDIGSNSIKLLVTTQTTTLKEDLRGSRIGEGIAQNNFNLTKNAIQRNITALSELLSIAQSYHPNKIIAVATSAIRDAHNRNDFISLAKQTLNLNIKILSGQEEASLIAHGIKTDPLLQSLTEFNAFDIGGGSLECIHYQNNQITSLQSLPLGIVRLTEQFIPNPQKPIPNQAIQNIIQSITQSTNTFPTPNITLIGAGGGFSEAKKILQKNSPLQVTDLENLLQTLASLPLKDRIEKYHIPPFRADVMPTALAIIIALAHKAHAKTIIHTKHTLRAGIAALAFENKLQF